MCTEEDWEPQYSFIQNSPKFLDAESRPCTMEP